MTLEEWAAVCRRYKAVEEEYMGREHEMDSLVERIVINADYDDYNCKYSQNLQLVETV